MRWERRFLGVVVGVALLAGACSARGGAAAAGSEEGTAGTPGPSGTPLEFRWHQDSDGNQIPDFVERDLGYDPLSDDCAQPCAIQLPQENVVVVLDAARPVEGEDVREALSRFALGALPQRRMGLVVGGDGGRAGACESVDARAPLGDLTADAVRAALPALRPGGSSPLAAALQRTAQLLPPADGEEVVNRVVLIATGGDDCEGDTEAAIQALQDDGATVDVIGLGLREGLARTGLQALAEATGGTYQDLSESEELQPWAEGEVTGLLRRLREAPDCAVEAGTAGACDTQLADEAVAVIAREQDAGVDDDLRTTELGALIESIRAHARGSSAARREGAGTGDAGLAQEADRIELEYEERFGGFEAPRTAAVRPTSGRTVRVPVLADLVLIPRCPLTGQRA